MSLESRAQELLDYYNAMDLDIEDERREYVCLPLRLIANLEIALFMEKDE